MAEVRKPLADLFRTKQAFDNILNERAQTLGMDKADVLRMAEADPPQFVRAVRERAARMGISEEELLQRELDKMLRSTFPTGDCLNPGEVEEYVVNAALPDARRAHLDSCQGCQAMVRMAQPDPARLRAHLEELRWLLSRVATVAVQRSGSGPLRETASSTASAAVAAAGLRVLKGI
jgi:hypothetical protein